VMTDFMAEVRKAARDASVRLGHTVAIGVRVGAYPKMSVEKGLDVDVWAKRGLVDFVFPCNMWANIRFDISANDWRAWIGDRATVVPGADSGITENGKRRQATRTEYRRWATEMRKRGATDLYLFNLFLNPQDGDVWNGILSEGLCSTVTTEAPSEAVVLRDLTPTAAVSAVRSLRATGEKRPVVVMLKAGTHVLDAPLALDGRDGNVTWRADGNVTLTRAKEVTKAVRGADGVWSAPFACKAPPPPEAIRFGEGCTSAPVFFFGETWGTAARWPNAGWATVKDVRGKGHMTRYSAEGRHEPFVQGAFTVDTDRPAKWDFDAGVYMAGYWTHDWAIEHVRTVSFDAAEKLFRVSTNSVICYGIKGENTWSALGRRFYAYHVRAELDAPGEWYFDRKAQRVDFIPPQEGAPMRGVPSLGPIVTAEGLSDFRFEGVRFVGAAGDGLVLKDCSRVTLDGATVADCTGDALRIEGGKDVVVTHSHLHGIGNRGVWVTGGDRRRLVRSGHRIERCRIHDYGRLVRTLSTAATVDGCGVDVVSNEIWDAPHSAVLYGGNEHRFLSNEVHHVLLETGDAGAFYAGRDPTARGNVLAFNFVHDLGNSSKGHANTMAFYFDDCVCGQTLVSNRVLNVARGLMLGGGQDNRIVGNVFGNCEIGMSIDARGLVWKCFDSPTDVSWQMTRKVKEMPVDTEPWKSRYPLLAGYLADNPRMPMHNPVHGNRFVGCTKKLIALEMWRDEATAKLDVRDNAYCDAEGRPSAKPDVRLEDGLRRGPRQDGNPAG